MPRKRHALGLASALVVATLPVLAAGTARAVVTTAPGCLSDPPSGAAPAPAPAPGGFTPIAPVRLVDTRGGADPGDPAGRITGDCTVALTVPGAVAPDGAIAVALNVTAVDAAARGYLTVFPCDAARPLASNLNPQPGRPTPNLVVVAVEADRRVCVYSSVATHLVVDATGWFGPGGQPFHATTGARLVDTRTVGGQQDGPGGRVAGGSLLRVPVAGVTAVPAGATALAVDVTAVDAAAAGYAVAFACDELPATSTVAVRTGHASANQAYVGLAPSGELCVYTSVTTHVVVDLVGWFGPGGASEPGQSLLPAVPARVADTRLAGGLLARPTPGSELRLDLAATGHLAPDAVAVVLDVVTTGTEADGYVVLYPCGTPPPPTSSLDPTVGDEVTNVVTVALSGDGAVCGVASTPTDLVIDVLGAFVAPAPLATFRTGVVPLTPRFDPAGLDYTVRCPASGPLDLPVVATGAPGATVTVTGPDGTVVAGPAPSVAALVPVAADGLVTVTVQGSGGRAPVSYALRCLPNDFPLVRTLTRTTPTPGWYLLANGFGPASGTYAVILDDRGAVVWYRRTSTPVLDLKRLPDGNLAWAPLLAANQGFGVDPTTVYLEYALDGTQQRSFATVGGPTDHHDMVALPGGHVLLLTYEKESGVVLAGSPACVNGTNDVWWSNVEELDATGAVVWSWHSRDHLTPADSTYLPALPIPGCDLQHADSIDVADNGDLIVAMRHLDAVLRIRRHPGQPDDGQVVWRLGGNASSFVFLDDPDAGPARPHDARLAADGTLSLVDNRTARPGEAGRVVVYRLDTADGSARLLWSQPFTAPVTGQTWSGGLGSVRRQTDGHTVVGWGDQPSPQLTEYDASGAVVLAVETPDSWGYRVVKEPAAAFDRTTLRATAGRGP